ncbi:MAG: CHC2 zinc finger domain-containing protein, partial [Ruminococcus sp.]|nr:CHC2 zinc finger domain-containing protein [Ruminococcus sp.]
MAFSDEFLELLRNTCTMESVASDYVSLKRSGRNYVCNCPFHSEKSPSCTIFPDTQSFYCFGCGVGGDVIMWIRHIETMEFPEAVRFLAEKAGLEIPTDREAQQQVAYRKQLMAANREAANFYYLNLVKGTDKRGLQYFISRGLKPETIRKYGLGFASDNWTSLTQHLLQKGFIEQELLDAD